MAHNFKSTTRESSHVDTVLHLVFSGGASQENDDELDDLENQIDELDRTQRSDRQQAANQRPSIYVKVFQEMLEEVESFERDLLDDKEWALVCAIKNLDYQSHYLLVRLLCRNRGRWLRYKHLEKYVSEIGEHGIRASMSTLSENLNPDVQCEPSPEVIDLTGDSDEEDKNTVSGPPTGLPSQQKPIEDQRQLDCFCFDESTMSLELILDTLDVQDLKGLTKDLKVASGSSKKSELKAGLLKHARGQTILPLQPSPKKAITKSKATANRFKQTTLSFSVASSSKNRTESQEQRLRQLALKQLGKCISVNADVFLLMRRLCILYYRCVQMPRDLMRPSLLSEFKKRTYPTYNYKRSTIFESRANLLAFEAALELEDEMQTILDTDDDAIHASIIAATPAPMHVPKRQDTPHLTRSQDGAIQAEVMDVDEDDILLQPSVLEIRSQKVKNMLEETILPKWRACVQEKRTEQNNCDEHRPGLDRFEPGFVYTRMVSKGTEALGHLKEYEAEATLLDELLDQRFWRRGKRGLWYDRRALVTTTYLSKSEGKKRKNNKMLRQAMEGLRQALEDEDTHIVCRPGLLRRLQKLEKTLKIPEDQRAQCEGELKEPNPTEVRATRVQSDPFKAGTPSGKENKPIFGTAGNGGRKWGTKSIWYGDQNEEVNVETRALQDYEKEGYRGFHAETSIVTTIFGLLFWDIIFADVPGAFETKFQVAPLDIAEDSFYHGRKELIDKRLKELRKGMGSEIMERHDRMYRSTNTWCVGVRWDLCPREDLMQIVKCFTGASLAMICELFCEDYAGRSGGVPDLIIWKYEEREVKFVEVKGPGDRPSENQKLWFDALHRANVEVDLCHVIDMHAKVKRLNNTLKRKSDQMAVADEEVLSGDEEEDVSVRRKVKHETEGGGDGDVLSLSASQPARRPPKRVPTKLDVALTPHAARPIKVGAA